MTIPPWYYYTVSGAVCVIAGAALGWLLWPIPVLLELVLLITVGLVVTLAQQAVWAIRRPGHVLPMIEDRIGNAWMKCGPGCDMRVVRPGQVQCSCQPAQG
jgi:hypothetical protein